MQIQETTTPARKRLAPRLRMMTAGLLALFVAALASSGLVAFGAFHNNGEDGLVEVGPIASTHPFPVWYRDTEGTRLELCLDVDSYCLLTSADLPRPGEPLDVYSTPANDPTAQPGDGSGNFPGEAFWFAADSIYPADSGMDASLVLALEAAFLAPNHRPVIGTNIVFGRVRIRITGLQGGDYVITHPYGTDTHTAEAGEINVTEDIGLDPAGIGALNSRIGPFLTAVDPPPPAGYIGDPGVQQTVTGSPYGNNFFRIEGAGIGTNPNYPCVGGPAPADPANCIQYDRFAMAGKYATNGGVDFVTALYERDGSGNTVVNVYAKSEIGEAITAKVNDGGSYTTLTHGTGTSYYARIALNAPDSDAIPSVTVANPGDVPPVSKIGSVKDMVTIHTAEYNADTGDLTIVASSSDSYGGGPALSYNGQPLVGGTLTVNGLSGAPELVTVTSAAGGYDIEQVRVVGAGYAPISVLANPGAIQTVVTGQLVTLDGSGSTGDVSSYEWTAVNANAQAVSLTANGATATFTAPANTGDTNLNLRFGLTVHGPGGPSYAETVVRVRPNNLPPVARAGADQTVLRGTTVNLDGSTSTNALSYSWVQLSGPTVTLSGANTARPSFTFPQSANNVRLELTATGPGGVDTDVVVISPHADTVSILSAQNRGGEWRVRGTAGAYPGNIVYIYSGNSCPVGGGPATNLIGSIAVDALGDWDWRASGGASNRVSVCTLGGARVQNFVVRLR